MNGFTQDCSTEPVISREFLRSVCEPFFEQMLTAVQQALQQTRTHQRNEEASIMQSMAQMTSGAPFPPAFHPASQYVSGVDEVSTADETGAFASLFSGSPSEGESIDSIEAKLSETEALTQPVPSHMSNEDPEQNSDNEKTIMVCRHWRTKGWCRLETNCKFLHPEHKRGIAAGKGCSGFSADDGSIRRAACPDMSSMFSLPDAINVEDGGVASAVLPRRKRRGGRNRSSREQQVQLDILEQDVADLHFLGCS